VVGGKDIEKWLTDAGELEALLSVLPKGVLDALGSEEDREGLLEVLLDLGRLPEARFLDHDMYLGDQEVTAEDLQHVVDRTSPFGDDNRSGIERTLHRISAIRNRGGTVIGLTCRVGRAVRGSARVVEDLALSGKSVLLVGRPGVGKTTVLRELARVLAESGKRVVIVDTSNEIAGDGDIPHPAIGKSRRMQVASPHLQHAVMIEAVENHMPQAIVVDEMGTELEALAARTIAERGVQLIATAHGNTLENLLVNPTLSDLVGGVHTVTLGDEEARRRRTQKTILERKAPPTFDVLVEIQSWDKVAVHVDVARSVDAVLRGRSVSPEIRELDASGVVRKSWQRPVGVPEFEVAPFSDSTVRHRWSEGSFEDRGERRERREERELLSSSIAEEPERIEEPVARAMQHVFPFGVSRERLGEAAADATLNVAVADNVAQADMVLTTKAHYRRRPHVIQTAEERGIPIFVLRKNTPGQIVSFLSQVADGEGDGGGRPIDAGTSEAEKGVDRILTGDVDSVELQPQSAFVRRVQHRIAEQSQLRSSSVGREPQRRVTIRRSGRR
jgi:stage III sporulation protein SpoIIIAA